MMQTQFFPALALLAVVQVVTGAYVCPSGYNDKTGTPLCAGAVSSTCTTSNCCAPTPTCASFSAAWLVEQVSGQGCAADKNFFDTNKLAVEVASPRGSDEVKAACCTPFANAKCSDWALVLGSCPAGKNFVGTNSCPADGADGKSMSSDAKYHENCCVEAPKTCSSFSAKWLTAQILGSGCAADKGFFNTNKLAVTVASPAGDDEVKAACCTPFANAKCSDWAAVMGSCPAGKNFVGTNSCPADGANGKSMSSNAKYHENCCVETPKTCSSFSAAWLTAQVLGSGCAADKGFFDTKKLAVEVASPAGDGQVKAACCTPFADAKCSDWLTKSCASGSYIVGTNSAPPDNSDGKSLSQEKFRDSCCTVPMKCADYTADTEASRSMSQAAISMVAMAGVLAAWVGA